MALASGVVAEVGSSPRGGRMVMRDGRGEDQLSDVPTLSLETTGSEDLDDSWSDGPRRDRVAVTLGETVGRYQVRRLLGEGGMGQVYLARDVVLGRSVALKLVGPGRTGLRTERFLDEARAIARLNHPHVVQLYDFGEYRGGLYLALEYVEGETLRERASRGALGLDEVLRHARAIADGLAHAHAAGVYHCDLKPSNVMIGRDGRVRVVDFGIARTRDMAPQLPLPDGAPRRQSGTPDWMAPEQWTGAPLTDRVDSWALGVVTAQLLTGAHPLGDDVDTRRNAVRDPSRAIAWRPERADVPSAVTSLINRALASEPATRPSATEWARVLDAALLDGRGDATVEDGPFRGLAPFDEQHARFYFGRELEIDAFLERLRDTPCLPIVGPSGAGKSSFLHAGVIPRLRARGPWTVIAFRPGTDPVGALARHVLAALGDERASEAQRKAQLQAFRGELLETPTLLAARLATLARTHGSNVLLAVDQLEEAFTQGAGEAERLGFLHMLLAAADDPLDPVRVVVTVRDDFVGKLAGLSSLFVVKKLGVDDVRRTITGPLARYDYQFDDPAIVDDLIAEVGSAEAANLPLLQFACRTLWDGRDAQRRRLLRATYREMGGLAGALARHADHALTELSPDEHRVARQLLLQLVVGTTRRSVARDQLVAVTGAPGTAATVLDRLLTARLLVQRNPGDGEAPILEIAHESLVQTWSQLARWLDESREERRLLDELHDAAKLWERRGRRSEDTWSEKDLATTRHRAAQLGLALPSAVEAFFAAGDARHEAKRRRRRTAYSIAFAVAAMIAVPVVFFIGKYVSREAMIDSNLGTVDLVVVPFDWAGAGPVLAGERRPLAFALHAASPDDDNEPGPLLLDKLVDIAPARALGPLQLQRIRAPGGTVFLEIAARGRVGERCASSWIRILSFPGYRTDAIRSVVLWVPTCQATTANTVLIEAGPFIYGGPGEPRSRSFGENDYTEPERVIELREYAIDRVEVANAAFAPFGRLEKLTGYRAPIYASYATGLTHANDADPRYPVSSVDAATAEAFCRYMGKRLPSDAQWVKAARGGLAVHGAPNPSPRRLFPWVGGLRTACVNLLGGADGYSWTAPVDAFACGASPYGVLQLAGNVQEWIARDGQTDRDNPLHALRGGMPDAPAELDHTTTIFRNHRAPYALYYSNGIRCVIPDPDGPR